MNVRLKSRFTHILLTSILIVSFTGLQAQMRDRILVSFENQRRAASLSTVQQESVLYASLEEFSQLLNIKHFYNPQNKKLVMTVGSRSIKVTALNPFIIVDNMAYQLALPTLIVDGHMYAPLALFLQSMGGFFPAEFHLNLNTEELNIRRFRINITGVEVEQKRNGSLIRIFTTKEFQETEVATSVNRDWLNVSLYGGVLDSVQIASSQRMGIVKQIAPFQFEKSAQVSFQLDGSVADRSVYIQPGEVVVSIRSPGSVGPLSNTNSNANRERWLINKIIIDPGHGGKDPGAVGPTGLMEKTVNLDIAKRLKDLIEKRFDIEVLLTREDDRHLRLKERTQFANTHDGKLFISIHANSNPSRRIRGVSTYVLGIEKSEQALSVAEKENSVIELEESVEVYREYQDAAHILNAIAQSSYLKESQDLAGMVNECIRKKTNLPRFGNGIYHGRFYVLVGAAMPRILVEVGFISNKHEERLLKTRAFRQKVAEAIFESIQNFKSKYEAGIG